MQQEISNDMAETTNSADSTEIEIAAIKASIEELRNEIKETNERLSITELLIQMNVGQSSNTNTKDS